uniref:Pink-eyed dilution-like protein n=1 Tax=Salpingoeca urceolata TaxID=473813 RepID=A0A1D8RAG5_9EUKA|nr:pink-eyed dilution-like protein [Salpingoeca urceolata]|eukprot:m.486704 g.486704  ORF g.486704 m.486704 type:complete len:720 (-) comp24554_c0_seq1:300-2459(-)
MGSVYDSVGMSDTSKGSSPQDNHVLTLSDTHFGAESVTDEEAPLMPKVGHVTVHPEEERGRWWLCIRGYLMNIKGKVWRGRVKTFVLMVALCLSAYAFAREKERPDLSPLYSVSSTDPAAFPIYERKSNLEIDILVQGGATGQASFLIQDIDGVTVEGSEFTFELDDYSQSTEKFERLLSLSRSVRPDDNAFITTTSVTTVAMAVDVVGVSAFVKYEVIYAALILVFVYFLIIFELIHRTLSAMLGSFVALAVLSVLNKRPSLEVIIGWIDYETVMLLFGMMIIVGILSQTGIFEWAAVKAYKISKGRIWTLITLLCVFAGVVSAFLDNVTTILLLTPVTIRMCNVIGVDPRPILVAEVVFSNIGGTATAVGDPPNVIIVSSSWDEVDGESDINFTEFTLHMFIGIIFLAPFCYLLIRFLYRNVDFSNPDPPEVAEIKREIVIWQRTAARLGDSGPDENKVKEQLEQKVRDLEAKAQEALRSASGSWEESVKQLEQDNRIQDKELLTNSLIVLSAVIIMFFIHSIPAIHLDLGWIAVLGAICLLVVADVDNLEVVLEKIEWGTLLFFASLFILMEALAELGLISWIGEQTTDLIESVPESSRLAVAIILVLWISAIASSFVDNIPFTAAMIPVIKSICNDAEELPLRPLVWALAFGACLGGNGTLIGASANVVCAGLAEQDGVTISFNYFFKTGFPVMLLSTLFAMFYLLVCHVALEWH